MRALLVAAAVAALAGATAAPRSDATASGPVRATKTLPPVLGVSYRSSGGALAWYEPLTLRMRPGRKAPLAGHLGSWAFSADRSVLAIASCGETWGETPGIRLVNARAMRVLGDIRLSWHEDCATSLTWLERDRLLAVARVGNRSELVVVDPVARRVVRREPLPDGATVIGRTPHELVLLLAPFGTIAPAHLAVADSEGRVRVASVDGVLAGTVEGSADHSARTIRPGLAVDPEGRRAFLVPHSGAVAEIDLATLAVSYHELDRASLLERFLQWLTPSAQAKLMEGPVRDARWLGNGMIAVSGVDHTVTTSARGRLHMVSAPAGVSLVDTRSWTTRMLSHEGSGFAAGAGLVIAQGGRWNLAEDRGYGPGLHAFSLDGRERWRLRPGEYRWMDPAGPVGYVYIGEWSAEVVDLATGSVLATVGWDERNPLPQLLAEQASSW